MIAVSIVHGGPGHPLRRSGQPHFRAVIHKLWFARWALGLANRTNSVRVPELLVFVQFILKDTHEAVLHQTCVISATIEEVPFPQVTEQIHPKLTPS